MGGRGRSPAVAPGCGRFHGPAAGEEGQAAMGTQTLIWARAVSAGTRGPPGGKLSRALVVRSQWRSMSTRRRARLAIFLLEERVLPPAAGGHRPGPIAGDWKPGKAHARPEAPPTLPQCLALMPSPRVQFSVLT